MSAKEYIPMEYTIHITSERRSKDDTRTKFSVVANQLSISSVCGFKPREVKFDNFLLPQSANYNEYSKKCNCHPHEIYIQIDPIGRLHNTLDGKGATCIIPLICEEKTTRIRYFSDKKYILNSALQGNALHIKVEDANEEMLEFLYDWSFDITFYP